MLRFLDVIAVSMDQALRNWTEENPVGVILLLIAALVVSALLVNTYILKKNKKEEGTSQEDAQ